MNKRTMRMAGLVLAAGLSSAAQAALHDRGSGLIYDDVLNVTWLQDTNYARTSGYDADGLMTWDQAVAWAANLVYHDGVRNVDYDDWRLPNVGPANGISFNLNYSTDGSTDVGFNIISQTSELAYMYYVNLGNLGLFTSDGTERGCTVAPDFCLQSTGPFSNLQAGYFWSQTEDPQDPSSAWQVSFLSGYQLSQPKNLWEQSAWAVRAGDVAAVPEATTWAMLLAGLGLVGAATRRRHR